MAGPSNEQMLKTMQGLPLSELICDPLVSAAKSQRKLAEVTLDFVSSIGFETDPKTKKVKTRTVDVETEVPIKGQTGFAKRTIKMPLLTMVKTPNLAIDDVKIHFDMEIKSHTEDKTGSEPQDHSESETHAEGTVSGHFWGVGFSATAGHSSGSSHTGTVTSSQTRETDFSARYSVDVSAKALPAEEGLARFTQMLATSMEPIDTQATA